MSAPAGLVAPTTPHPAQTRARGVLAVSMAVLRCARPHQWIKNVLVLAVPLAAGALGDGRVIARTAAAVVIFIAVSSGTYLLNDARDVERDARHPEKRLRPVASGAISVRLASIVGVALLVAGIGGASWESGSLALLVGTYVLSTTAYSLGLKHVPYAEMAVVVAGFVLRADAGGAAAHLPTTAYFQVVTASGAAFLVLAKRYAERCLLAERSSAHRPVLRRYPPALLAGLLVVAATCLCVGYGLWAAARGHGVGHTLNIVSFLPVAAGLVRYGVVVSRGGGGAPEQVLLHDRVVQVIVLSWLALFSAALWAS